MFRPFLIVNTSLTCRFILSCRSLVIAIYTASALLTIDWDRALNYIIRGYTLKTSSVRTKPSGPAILFIALTTIYKINSLLIYLLFSSY